MKRTLLVVLLYCLYFPGYTQIVKEQKGIQFEQGLSWIQILKKARKEHKYIFVDCFATWCGPCKSMDANVYPLDSVGILTNKNFISVKVQCDVTHGDNATVRSWYKDAQNLMNQYKITAFPSFLFFSPNGKLVDIATGYHNAEDFLMLTRQALDPSQQYYTLLENYKHGSLAYKEFPTLAAKARNFNDKIVLSKVANTYVHDYLGKLNDSAFCTKNNFDFILTYDRDIISSKDRAFDWYYNHPKVVDSIMKNEGYAKSIADFIISREEITPYIDVAKVNNSISPDWQKIEATIKEKFGADYAIRNIIAGKIKWASYKNDWEGWGRNWIKMIEQSGYLNNIEKNQTLLNNLAYQIFQKCNDKENLKNALKLVEKILGISKDWDNHKLGTVIDTQANLLYKLGQKDEALMLERKALLLSPQDKEIQRLLGKMEQGQPTW